MGFGTLASTGCMVAEQTHNMIADIAVLVTMAIGNIVLALLWSLHRDMRSLHEDLSHDMGDLRARVSRIEGMLAGAGLTFGSDPASR